MQFTTSDYAYSLVNGRCSRLTGPGPRATNLSVRVLRPVSLGHRPRFLLVADACEITLPMVTSINHLDTTDLTVAVEAWLTAEAAAWAASHATVAIARQSEAEFQAECDEADRQHAELEAEYLAYVDEEGPGDPLIWYRYLSSHSHATYS